MSDEGEKHMKPEAKATDNQLRETAFRLTLAIIEGDYKKAEKHAESIVLLINHLKKGSQQ